MQNTAPENRKSVWLSLFERDISHEVIKFTADELIFGCIARLGMTEIECITKIFDQRRMSKNEDQLDINCNDAVFCRMT